MTTRRVLVTDSDERSALAACRALAAAGLEVTAGSSRRVSPAAWSRSVKRHLRLPDPRSDQVGFVDALARELQRHPQDVLLCSTEAAALAVSPRRDRVDGLCRHGLPRHEVLEHCLDKREFMKAARAVGLEPPPSVVAGTSDEARAAAETFGFPVIVKPWRSVTGNGATREHAGSVIIDDREVLSRTVARFGLPVIVQERDATPEIVSVGGVFAGGRLLATVVSHYLRTWPQRAGSASFSETVEPPSDLLTQVEALLSRLGFDGLFEVELIRRRDGRFAAIDFNPRIYGSMTLAEAAGVNLAAIWCDHLLDGDRDVPPARVGVRYRYDDAEVRNALCHLRKGRMRESLEVMRPHRAVTHAYFRWNDPGPPVARVIELFSNRLGRALRRSDDTPGVPVRTMTGATTSFHYALAYAVGVPLVLMARVGRVLKRRPAPDESRRLVDRAPQ
jgi:predicted ATP-grasp superfamily ATP-dependent carboligase